MTMAIEIAMEIKMAIEMTTEIKITIVAAMVISMAISMAIETAMKMLLAVFIDAQDISVIPQIPLGLHTAGNMARPAMTCTIVVYAATLPLVTKGLTR